MARVLADLRWPVFWLAVARVLACGGPRSGLRWPALGPRVHNATMIQRLGGLPE